MKARTIIFIAMAVVALSLTSCEKSETGTFKVTIKPMRSAGKDVSLPSSVKTRWAAGDIVNINGTNQEVRKQGSNYIIPAGSASGPYYAMYPGGTSESRNYSITSLEPLPMFAYAENAGGSLEFRTPYSIIQLTITNHTSEAITEGQLTFPNLNIKFAPHVVNIGSEGALSFTEYTGAGGNLSFGSIARNGNATFYLYIMPDAGISEAYVSGESVNHTYAKEATSTDFNFASSTVYPMNVEFTDDNIYD